MTFIAQVLVRPSLQHLKTPNLPQCYPGPFPQYTPNSSLSMSRDRIIIIQSYLGLLWPIVQIMISDGLEEQVSGGSGLLKVPYNGLFLFVPVFGICLF